MNITPAEMRALRACARAEEVGACLVTVGALYACVEAPGGPHQYRRIEAPRTDLEGALLRLVTLGLVECCAACGGWAFTEIGKLVAEPDL